MADQATNPAEIKQTRPEFISVLLADDSAVLRRNVRKLISNTDALLEVREADSVSSALYYLKRFSVDLLILDLQFADGTGFDVLKQLGLLPKHPLTVVLTNFPSETNRVRARELGADYFLDKSHEYEQVLPVLDEVCRAHGIDTSETNSTRGNT